MKKKLKKWVAMIGLMALCLLAIGGTVGAAGRELSPKAASGARLGTQQENSTLKPNDAGDSAVVDGGFLTRAGSWAKDHGVGLLYGLGVGLVVGLAVAGVAVLLVVSAPVSVIVGAGALAGGLYGLITGAIRFDIRECALFSAIAAVSAGVGTGLAAGWLARTAVDVVGGGLAMVGSYLLHEPHPTWGGAGQAFVVGALTAGVFVGLGAAANKLFGPALGRLGGKLRNLLPWGRGAGTAAGEAGAAGGSPALAEAVGPGVQREVTVGGAAISETNPAMIARTVETVAPKFSRGYMQSLRSFQEDMAEALSAAGLSRGEFDQLRLKPTDHLTDAEIATLMKIRDSVPAPTTDTLLQRVIRPDQVDKYLSGDYKAMYGFVTRAGDVKVLSTPGQVKSGLRLDYKGNPFIDDQPMYLIRFKAQDPTPITTAYGGNSPEAATRVSGTVGSGPQMVEQDFPFTGHGFTSDRYHVVPEYHTATPVRVQDGAELIQLTPRGEERLIAVYRAAAGKFVEVAKGWR